VLNNELYIGRLVWNRQRCLKDLDSGKRIARLNPETDWVIRDVPELRIVDDALWLTVRQRQASLKITPNDSASNPLVTRRRPKYLFAGLSRCGCCGGAYALISKNLLGCTTARNKGTCANRVNIRREALEASVINGLRQHLMEPTLFAEFCEEFTREVNRLRMEASVSLDCARHEALRVDRELDKLMKLILASEDIEASKRVMKQMKELEARKEELERTLTEAAAPPPLLHPSLSEVYRTRITSLSEALSREDTCEEAAQVLRSLVSAIELTPEGGVLAITLRGDLAAMLSIASNYKKPGVPSREPGLSGALGAQLSLVAGKGSHRLQLGGLLISGFGDRIPS